MVQNVNFNNNAFSWVQGLLIKYLLPKGRQRLQVKNQIPIPVLPVCLVQVGMMVIDDDGLKFSVG